MMIHGYLIFCTYIKKNKILSLQKHIKKKEGDKIPLIYKTHTIASGLIELYGKNLSEAVKKRDRDHQREP